MLRFAINQRLSCAKTLKAHMTALYQATSTEDQLLQFSIKLSGIINLRQNELPEERATEIRPEV